MNWLVFTLLVAAIRNGSCQTESQQCEEWPSQGDNIEADPRLVSVYGQVPIRFGDPCFEGNAGTEVTCTFADRAAGPITVPGKIVKRKLVCMAPFFYRTGHTEVTIKVKNAEKEVKYMSNIWVGKETPENVLDLDIELHEQHPGVVFKWRKEDFLEPYDLHRPAVELVLDLHILTLNTKTGRFEQLTSEHGEPLQEIPIRLRPPTQTEVTVTRTKLLQFLKKTLDTAFLFSLGVRDNAEYRPILVTSISKSMEIWSLVRGSTLAKGVKNNKIAVDFVPQQLMNCPTTLKKAKLDERFLNHTYLPSNSSRLDFFHHGADECFVSRENFNPTGSHSGQECCYKYTNQSRSDEGHLICGHEPGIGRPHNYSSETHLFYHFAHDVAPWAKTCFLHGDYSKECQEYLKNRIPDCTREYDPPRIFQCWGLSHCFTFDHTRYDFHGYGEYWMFKSGHCQGQIRKRPGSDLQSPDKKKWKSTFQEAVVFSCQEDDPIVIQIQVSAQNGTSLEMYINRKLFIVDEGWKSISMGNITIDKGDNQFIVSFHDMTFTIKRNSWQNGASLDVHGMITGSKNGSALVNHGLLGDSNGDPKDDLTARNGTIVAPDASLAEIHYVFGESWRIKEEESMFVYGVNQSHNTSNQPGFEPILEPPTTTPEITKVCKGNLACAVEINQTGSAVFGNQSLVSEERFESVYREFYGDKVVLCKQLPPLQNGHYDFFGGHAVGARARPVCEAGYILLGRKELECVPSGKWSAKCGRHPRCVPKKKGQDVCHLEQDTCYARVPGFPASNKHLQQCSEKEQNVCPDLPTPKPNTYVVHITGTSPSGLLLTGTKVDYKCRKGSAFHTQDLLDGNFTKNNPPTDADRFGQLTVECTKFGQWSPAVESLPRCSDFMDCKKTRQGKDYFGHTVNYSIFGNPCLHWSTQNVDNRPQLKNKYHCPQEKNVASARNSCRNPLNLERPFCIVNNASNPIEFCDVPTCEDATRFECKLETTTVRHYLGTANKIHAGQYECRQRKDASHDPGSPDFNGYLLPDDSPVANNFCRYTHDVSGGPWCYPASSSAKWDVCPVDFCPGFP